MSDETIAGKDDRWHEVRAMQQDVPNIEFGQHVAYWFHRSPRRTLHATSYYKFAAKMVGKGKRVLDIGCGEGLGTWLMAVECGQAKGVDFDADAIASAQRNWIDPRISFECGDAFELPGDQKWDAVVNFDVIEHIYPEHADQFLEKIAGLLAPEGVVVIGTPNITSRQYASAVTNAGHVNMYSGERLEESLSRLFHHVFVFSANDEVVHTGFWPMAHYLLALACDRREA
ncbi:MAG: class I SAM-dependent methyltransferase [Dehalococcoidia bacterium]